MNNLIGISGKAGSGKDTVGKILQYLEVAKYPSGEEYNNWLQRGGFTKEVPNYQIKKFADKLKDIVCLLIGCTREQLEDREFKEKELGEEWNIWVLVPNPDHNLFDGNCQLEEVIFSSSDEAKRCIKEHKIINVLDIEERALTPRKILQLLGTEAGRDIIHPNIWVNALFADYIGDNVFTATEKDEMSGTQELIYPNWIITDVRFPNELKAIEDRGGMVIRVDRANDQTGISSSHESETALDNHDFKYHIQNDGSIEELVEKVKQITQ